MPTIASLGEDALIRLFAPRLPHTDAEIVGPGDDSAVLRVDGDVVASTDTLIEGGHFRREWSTGADVGFRAAMQNLADIDAMGARPLSLQVSLGAPPDTDAEWVTALADGLREACEPLGVGVSGGDLVSSPSIMVSVTAIGDTAGQAPVLRAGARVGDEVAVAAPLGAAAAGFFQLDNGLDVDAASKRLFLRPSPRVGSGREAAAAGAHALIDVSDGLLRDLGRLALASGVGIEIDRDAVPVHPGAAAVAAACVTDALEWALAGGEDHHLAGTFAPGTSPRGWFVVGRVVDTHAGVHVDGKAPTAVGWDHFTP